MIKSTTTLIIALCILAPLVATGGITMDIFKSSSKECAAEIGVEINDLFDLQAGTHEAECFRKCILTKYGVLTDAGALDIDGSMKMVNELWANDSNNIESAAQALNTCSEIEIPSDPCETVAVLSKCLRDNDLNLF